MKVLNESKDSNEQTRYVYLRIDPRIGPICIDIALDSKCISLKNSPDINYFCDDIFYDQSQMTVCSSILKQVKDNSLNGKNCLILSYGLVGTGKTTTCFKIDGDIIHHGIAPRLIKDILENRPEDINKRPKVYVNYVEFIGDRKTDLCKGVVLESNKKPLIVEISSVDKAIGWLTTGGQNRKFKTTLYGPSHIGNAVLTIDINYHDRKTDTQCKSRIQLVDLAGIDNDKASKKNLTMEQIIYAMNYKCKPKDKILFNPLLMHLKETLGLNNLTKIIAHTTVGLSDINKLKKILNIGSTLTAIKNLSVPQSVKQTEEQRLKTTISQLKNDINGYRLTELQHDEMFTSKERDEQIRRSMMEFLENRRSKVSVKTVVKIDIAMDMFKTLYEDMKNKINEKDTQIQSLQEVMQQEKIKRNESLRRKSFKVPGHSTTSVYTVLHNTTFQPDRKFYEPLKSDTRVTDVSTKSKLSKKSNKKFKITRTPLKPQTKSEITEPKEKEPDQYFTNDQIHNFITDVQKSFLSISTALQQTKTELMLLRANLRLEAGVNLVSPRETMLNNFDEKIDFMKRQIDNYEASINDLSKRYWLY